MSKRMIDLLFTQGAMEHDRQDNSMHPWSIEAIREHAPTGSGQSLFHEAETLVVDNVTKYLYEVCEQEEWGGEDYPNCAPPFPTFWMETRAPAYIRSGKTVHPWHGQHAWGALFLASEIPANIHEHLGQPEVQARAKEATHQQWQAVGQTFRQHGITLPETAPASDEAGRAWFAALPEDCRLQLQHYITMAHTMQALDLSRPIAHEIRWHYQIVTFIQLTPHAPIHGPLLQGVALVDTHGRLIPTPTPDGGEQFVQWNMRDGYLLDAEARQQFVGLANVLLMPMWLALGFLHCKNVTLAKEDPCHARKPAKKGEQCRRLHYHVLNIQPMQEVLRREGRSQTTGLKQALSICRGHFKDYRQKGLFGKYQGLFWWDAHIRGSSREGVVVKDYNVHSTAPEAAHV